MIRSLIVVTALGWTQLCNAQCPLAQRIVSIWGVSFSGISKPVPQLSAKQRAQLAGQHLLLMRLPNPGGAVADGFEHDALLDLKANRAWLARHGGFVGVDEWYGPIALPDQSVIGCDVERYVVPVAAGRQR